MSSLNELLDRFDRRQREGRAHAAELRAEEERFCQQFREIRDTVILPVMEKVGRAWDGRGQSHRVERHDGERRRWVVTSHPGAWLTLYHGRPADEMTEENVFVRVGFLAVPSQRTALVYKTIASPFGDSFLGPGEAFALEAISPGLVEAEITKALDQNLGR